MFCREAKKFDCRDMVLRNTMAIPVADTKIILRVAVSLFCGPPIPVNGLGCIQGDTSSFVVAHAEIVLRECISLFRGKAIPMNGLGQVLFNTLTSFVADPDAVLCRCFALAGRSVKPL